MPKYKIFAGSINEADYRFTEDFLNEDDAELAAYNEAIEDYDMYAGLYGIRSLKDIIDEDEVDEEEAAQIYSEERESWLDYYVKLDDGIKEE